MEYQRLDEERLEDVLRRLHAASAGEERVVPAPESDTAERLLLAAEQSLKEAECGTQVGLQSAPMYRQRGLKRALARLVERLYLRVAELTNRDVRRFNGAALETMTALLDFCREQKARSDALSAELLRQKQVNAELAGRLAALEEKERG